MSGVVEAPAGRVWTALLELTPELSDRDREAVTRNAAAGQTYLVRPPGAAKAGTEVDGQAHTVATQGEWWYRGVTSVEPHPRGSLVVYRVYNVAPGLGWWAAQFVQGPEHARGMKPVFQRLLDALGERLGCVAYPAERRP